MKQVLFPFIHEKFYMAKVIFIIIFLLFFTTCKRNSLYDLAADNNESPSLIKVASGITEMSSRNLPNPIYDGEHDLWGLRDGDIIINMNDHNGTTIDNNSVIQDFCHIVGQDTPIISPGNTYIIGNSSIITDVTITDHMIQSANTDNLTREYINGFNHIYTDHGWLPPDWIGVGDIVQFESKYARIISISFILPSPPVLKGAVTDLYPNKLYDTVNKLIDVVLPGFFIFNINNTETYARVNTVVNNDELDISTDLFTNIGEEYLIFKEYCLTHQTTPLQFISFLRIQLDWDINITSGSKVSFYDFTGVQGTAGIMPTNPLFDNEANFTQFIKKGDIVINYSDLNNPCDPNIAIVDTREFPIHVKSLNLSQNIFTGNHDYEIIRTNVPMQVIETGIVIIDGMGEIIDLKSNLSIVHEGDFVFNITSDEQSDVLNVEYDRLTLSNDTMSIRSGDRYAILRVVQ